jgi:hypothetical protein
MKIYMTKSGVAHMELDIDEITEIQSALGWKLDYSPGDVLLAQSLHARISKLISYWIDGPVRATEPESVPREPSVPDTQRTPPVAQRMLGLDNPAESHKPA